MNDLESIIKSCQFLLDGDKLFLIDNLSNMSPVDKLRLKHTLISGQAPAILNNLRTMRDKFIKSETPKDPDIITKIFQKIVKPSPPRIVSHSYLNQPILLGGYTPKSPQFSGAKPLNKLKDIVSLSQLKLISPIHITFNLNQNPEIEIAEFIDKVETLLEKHNTIEKRRDQYMYFISSHLFESYIDTGLTASRHPELQSYIILNTLHQIDPKYLNGRQFKHASAINQQLKALVGL